MIAVAVLLVGGVAVVTYEKGQESAPATVTVPGADTSTGPASTTGVPASAAAGSPAEHSTPTPDASASATSSPSTASPSHTTASPAAARARSTSAGHKTSPTRASSSLDPRYLTCQQANAAGYGPYRKGKDPEYDWYWDWNDDGVVCDGS